MLQILAHVSKQLSLYIRLTNDESAAIHQLFFAKVRLKTTLTLINIDIMVFLPSVSEETGKELDVSLQTRLCQ